MARVAVVLIVLAGTAHAKREPDCTCFEQITLPERGAINVPVDTKAWRIGPRVVDIEIIELPQLLVELHEYHSNYEGRPWSFRTGNYADSAAPAPPGIANASFVIGRAAGDRANVESLLLSGRFDEDVVLLRVEATDHVGTQTFYVPPNRRYCNPGLSVASDVKLTIRAVDLAGNESRPVEVAPRVDVSRHVDADRCNRSPHVRCGMGIMVGYLLGVVGFFCLLLGVLFVTAIRRSRVPSTPGEPLSLLVAEDVVRLVKRKRALTSAFAIAATAMLFSQGYTATAFVFSVVPIVQLTQLFLARALMTRIELAGAAAERRDKWLYIANEPLDPVYIRASHRIFAAAKRNNVPKSIQV